MAPLMTGLFGLLPAANLWQQKEEQTEYACLGDLSNARPKFPEICKSLEGNIVS